MAEWQMANGKWQMAEWQMADGRWQMADGELHCLLQNSRI